MTQKLCYVIIVMFTLSTIGMSAEPAVEAEAALALAAAEAEAAAANSVLSQALASYKTAEAKKKAEAAKKKEVVKSAETSKPKEVAKKVEQPAYKPSTQVVRFEQLVQPAPQIIVDPMSKPIGFAPIQYMQPSVQFAPNNFAQQPVMRASFGGSFGSCGRGG